MTEPPHLGLHLLDRQVVDVDDHEVGKVDDVLFEQHSEGPPRLAGLLLGQQALGPRLGGRMGRWWTAVNATLSGDPDPVFVPIERVSEFEPVVRLEVSREDVRNAWRLERWLAERLVGRIPGAHRAEQ